MGVSGVPYPSRAGTPKAMGQSNRTAELGNSLAVSRNDSAVPWASYTG
jgi:hypothetical protein